jgi:hypothetical protein
MAQCCAEGFFLWEATCPTFIANPPAGLISEQKGVTRHIPQPEMPIMEPAKGLKDAIPAPVSAAQPPKVVQDMKMATFDQNFSTTNDNIDSILRYLRESRVLSDTTYDELAKRVNEISESTDVAYAYDALASDLTDEPMIGGPGERGYVQTKQGTMVILAVRASEAILTGSITVSVQKNGVSNGFTVSLLPTDEDPTYAFNRVDPGTYNYAAGDILSTTVTTSAGLTPAVDIDVSLGLVHG